MGERRKNNPNWEPVKKGGRVVGYRKKNKKVDASNLPPAASLTTSSAEEDIDLNYGNISPHIATHFEKNGIYPGDKEGTYVTPHDLEISNLNTELVDGSYGGDNWRQYSCTLTDASGKSVDVKTTSWESKHDPNYFMNSVAQVDSLPEPIPLEDAGFTVERSANLLEDDGNITTYQFVSSPEMDVEVKSMHTNEERVEEFSEGGKHNRYAELASARATFKNEDLGGVMDYSYSNGKVEMSTGFSSSRRWDMDGYREMMEKQQRAFGRLEKLTQALDAKYDRYR